MTYRFEPGAEDDGITVHVPVEVLPRLGGDELAWHVPALREELITELIRSLPKDLRRNFVPAPDTARALLTTLDPAGAPLLQALQGELRRRTGVLVPIDAFDLQKIPAHLRVTFAVESPMAPRWPVARTSTRCRSGLPRRYGRRSRVRSPAVWSEPDCAPGPTTLPNCSAPWSAPQEVTRCAGFPPWSTRASGVDVRVFATHAEQDAAMGPGTRRLLRLVVTSPVKAVERALNPRTRLLLGSNPDGSLAALLDDCADAAVDGWRQPLRGRGTRSPRCGRRSPLPWCRLRLTSSAASKGCSPHGTTYSLRCPTSHCRRRPTRSPTCGRSSAGRCPPAFVTATGVARLADLTRYLTAISRRLERLPHAVKADRDLMVRVQAVQDAYDDLVKALSPGRAAADDVRDIALA